MYGNNKISMQNKQEHSNHIANRETDMYNQKFKQRR